MEPRSVSWANRIATRNATHTVTRIETHTATRIAKPTSFRIATLTAALTLALTASFAPSLAPSPQPLAAAPARQAASPYSIHLPLVFDEAGRADLIPGIPAPISTPALGTSTSTPSPTSATATTPDPTSISGPTSTTPTTPDPTATTEPPPPIEFDGDWVRTPHYSLFSPSSAVDKRELGLMMELFYDQATAHFGAEPALGDGERLVGKIFADQASFKAGLIEDGILGDFGGAGGYYDPNGGAFYLFVQPSRHFTRTLTMHEAAHQLQHKAGGCRSPGWWTEGEAEYLGMHTWDGENLHLARQPLITLEDYPRSALEAFDAKGEDVGYVARGESGWSYREAWALVSFVHSEHPAEAEVLRSRYCAGDDAASGWAAAFGAPFMAEMNADYETWLKANQQPWQLIWNEFEPLGHDGFHGRSGANAIAVTKSRPDEFTLELEPITGSLRAGIIVGYHDTSDFVMLRLYADRRLEVIRVKPGWSWEWLLATVAPEPAPEAADRMSAAVVDGAIRISMNGVEVIVLDAARDLEGQFGINLEGCEVLMRIVDD